MTELDDQFADVLEKIPLMTDTELVSTYGGLAKKFPVLLDPPNSWADRVLETYREEIRRRGLNTR
ncbi:hypothetical protein NKJ84_23505 [Mesorhizobium sp. M0048]|uniref:hypothetical protein n=1 Tax=Mesorhizobium sp. M0048 TaxID=2956860 RepID=UPI00333928BF